MLHWVPQTESGAPLRILCLGAHCDDIEIGCGGTLSRLVRERSGTEFLCAILSSTTAREVESRTALQNLLEPARRLEIVVEQFRNAYFPYVAADIKDWFESLKRRFEPDLIFTHYGADAHQDHRTVSELTWNTFRNHSIVEFEIPKYDGDLGRPNVYVPLPVATVERKVDWLMESFPSQEERQWFSPDAFRSILRIRGIECAAPSGFAEAFFCRKLVVGLSGSERASD